MQARSYWALSASLIVFLTAATHLVAGQKRLAAEEGKSPYRKWVEEEAVYIISEEEKAVFSKLTVDAERERFIEEFWKRRDLDPRTSENEFRVEHYRRIAYANERFSGGGYSGWKTDRGMVYIKFGEPNHKESSVGGPYARTFEEGGGATIVYPFEKWFYASLPEIGSGVEFEFVDPDFSGKYTLEWNPTKKDMLLNMGLYWLGRYMTEQMTLDPSRTPMPAYDAAMGITNYAVDPWGRSSFEKIMRHHKAMASLPQPFPDLKAVVDARISYKNFPFQLQVDRMELAQDLGLVSLTVHIPTAELSYKTIEAGVRRATVEIYGKVETLTRVLEYHFSEEIKSEYASEELLKRKAPRLIHQRFLPVKPGRYKLTVVVKELPSGRIGAIERAIVIPPLVPTRPGTSDLILAEYIRPARPEETLGSPFVMACGLKVYPRPDQTFRVGQRIGAYLEAYRIGVDQQTRRPSVEITYNIFREGKVVTSGEAHPESILVSDNNVAWADWILTAPLLPGDYQLRIQLKDNISGQLLTKTAPFKLL